MQTSSSARTSSDLAAMAAQLNHEQRETQGSLPRVDVRGVSNPVLGGARAVRDGIALVGRAFRAAFASIGNALTSCFRPATSEDGSDGAIAMTGFVGGAEASGLVVSPELVKGVMQTFMGLGDKFSSLGEEQCTRPPEEVGQWFRALSASLQYLGKADGIPERSQKVFTELSLAPVLGGMTIPQLDVAIQEGRGVLAGATAQVELSGFHDRLRSALVELANKLGDAALAREMGELYSDQDVNELVTKLGMKATGGGAFDNLVKNPVYQPLKMEDIGGRFQNATNAETRVPLDNGLVYDGANQVNLHGIDAIICSYPRTRDLPAYFQMLSSGDSKVVNVLMSAEEIENKSGFPRYFAKDGVYGDFQVRSVPAGSAQLGALNVDFYDLTIAHGGEQKQVRVNHATDWGDFKGVDAQSLAAFTRLAGNDDPALTRVNHCRGGLGRAATCVAAMAINAGMGVEDAISSLRAARSPEMVQTVDQVRTLVYVERLREAESQDGARTMPAYENTGPLAQKENSGPSYVNAGFVGSEAIGGVVYENVR